MRARLAIDVAGVSCELREVVLADKPQALLVASPKATVPVWVDTTGEVIDQSVDIMRHVLAQVDSQSPYRFEEGRPDHVRNLQCLSHCDAEFKHHLDRYKYASRYLDADAHHHRAEAARFVQQLDNQLASAAFLGGEEQGWCDLAIAPFIRQFRLADARWFDQQPWSAVCGWLAGFEASALFARVMKKYPQWREGEAGIAFPEKGVPGHD